MKQQQKQKTTNLHTNCQQSRRYWTNDMYIINTVRLSGPYSLATIPATTNHVTLFPDYGEPRIIITCQQSQKMVSYFHLCINCAHKVGPRVYKSGKWACSQVYLSIHLYTSIDRSIYLSTTYPSSQFVRSIQVDTTHRRRRPKTTSMSAIWVYCILSSYHHHHHHQVDGSIVWIGLVR